MSYLHWLDYVVIAVLLVVSLGIGIFFAVYRGGQKTKVGYLLGNRQMSMIPVCLSMCITFQSAIALLGVPAEVFNNGTMYLFLGCGIGLSYIVSLFTVVPLIYPLHITSVYEYLELRFESKCVRLLVTSLGMLKTVLYMAVALFSPAIALQTAAGLPLWMSIAILGGICTVYTAVGGIKSVVWTDVFQTVVYVIGVGTVIVMSTLHVGSVTQAFRLASEGGRIQFDEINPDVRERHSLWSTLIGGCFMWLPNCFSQSYVQRISALKTLKNAKLAFLLNAPMNIFIESISTFTGVLLYACIVTMGCDPYQAGIIDNRNQMMPYFVPSLLGSLPGIPGLYMSVLFSGALSTLSSGINALGANSVEDLLARPLRNCNDATVTFIAKITVMLFGGLTIGLAYLARSLRGPVTQINNTVDGACGGPIIGIFFLAGVVPWGNKYGAIGGGLIGIAVNLWITIGSQIYGAPTRALPPGPTHNCPGNNSYSFSFYNLTTVDLSMTAVVMSTDTNPTSNITNVSHSHRWDTFSIYDISYLWLGVIGFLVTFITGILISFITAFPSSFLSDVVTASVVITSRDYWLIFSAFAMEETTCPTNKATLDPKLVFPFTRKLFRMKEPSQEAEDSANVIFMKTYENSADKFIENSKTMATEREMDSIKQDHLSCQPLM